MMMADLSNNRPSELAAQFRSAGCVLATGLVDVEVISGARDSLELVLETDGPERVLEDDELTVRSVYGAHRHVAALDRLARDPRLLRAVRLMLGGPVYIHQFKVNVKAAFTGDIWDWHQDYSYWRSKDGIERSDLLSAVVFLDNVEAYNGPLMVIPRSHLHGLLPAEPARPLDQGRVDESPWASTLTAAEQLAVPRSTVRELALEHGVYAPTAPSGSVFFFHANAVHASPSNMSPFDRRVAIVVYNRVDNPPHADAPRPWFLCEPSATEVDELRS